MKNKYLRPLYLVLTFLGLSIFYNNAYSQVFKPLRGGERMLWIADSFVGFYGPVYDATNAIYKVADPDFVPIYNGDAGKGCGRVKEYVVWGDKPGGTGALDSIRHGNWKYVFVQPENDAVDIYDVAETFMGCGGPSGYPKNQDTLIKYYKILDGEVKKVNSTLILWGSHYSSYNNDLETSRAKECYAKLRSQYSVPFFIPSYLAWDSVKTDFPTTVNACYGQGGNGFINMLYSDCAHQNGNGMAMDAYTLYTIYTGGLSGVGLDPTFPTPMATPSLRDYLAGVGCKIGRKILLDMGFPNDFEVPTIPTGLMASNITNNSFNLSWNSSTDNIGVKGYEIYLDGLLYNTTSTNSTTLPISSLGPGITYKVKLKAYDEAGHFTLYSQTLNVTTTGTSIISNGSFENPTVTNETNNPNGSSWIFTGSNVGITNDPPSILEGSQSAYIYKIDDNVQSLSQEINLTPGVYNCVFFTDMPGWADVNKPLRLVLGSNEYNINLGTLNKWEKHVVQFTVAQIGNTLIKFYLPITNTDQVYAYIDNVKIEEVANGTLPIDLTQFTGEQTQNGNELTWQVAKENNNKEFQILKSFGKQNFEIIAAISSKAPNGNSNSNLTYKFIDKANTDLSSYYKIKQVDLNGNSKTYPNLVLIKPKFNNTENTVFPNPANNEFTTVIYTGKPDKMQINLFDATGKLLIKKTLDANVGRNDVLVDISAYKAGFYLLKVTNSMDAVVLNTKVIKK
jgi:chitodextrinase